MPSKPDLTPHSEPTVFDLRDPADRTGDDTVIRERFKQSELSSLSTMGYSPDHQQLIEKERKKTAEQAHKTSVLRSKFKYILSFVAGGVLGMTGAFFIGQSGKTPKTPVFVQSTAPKPVPPPTPEPEKPETRITDELLKAELLKSCGQFKEALALVDKLLEEKPDDFLLLYTKAQILEDWGRKWKALNVLDEILKQNDENKNFELIKLYRNKLKNKSKAPEQ